MEIDHPFLFLSSAIFVHLRSSLCPEVVFPLGDVPQFLLIAIVSRVLWIILSLYCLFIVSYDQQISIYGWLFVRRILLFFFCIHSFFFLSLRLTHNILGNTHWSKTSVLRYCGFLLFFSIIETNHGSLILLHFGYLCSVLSFDRHLFCLDCHNFYFFIVHFKFYFFGTISSSSIILLFIHVSEVI